MFETRDATFDRITVDYLSRGGGRVAWRLARHFADPGPYDFTVQAGQAAIAAADDWTDILPHLGDVSEAVDPEPRGRGTDNRDSYRVLVTTPLATYASPPVAIQGILPKRDWLKAREIVRVELQSQRLATALVGWLFRRRRPPGVVPAAGYDPRTATRDYLTGETIRRSGSPAASTRGGDAPGGYFAPVPWRVSLLPGGDSSAADPSGRGTVDDAATNRVGTAVLYPPPEVDDVFVEAGRDRRFSIRRVDVTQAIRDVPLVGRVTLSGFAEGDVVDTLPTPASLPHGV